MPLLRWLRHRRRARLLAEPFPPAWDAILERGFPLLRRLPEADRRRLRERIVVFLAEKRFEGAGGLEPTDEVRVTVAAQACLLLAGREGEDIYPRLRSIVVYPAPFRGSAAPTWDKGIVDDGATGRLGESWTHGTVVLAWDSVRRGAADPRDGRNVVLHEFAHQLDQEDGGADGTPVLPRPSSYVSWARVLGAEYLALRRAADRRRRTTLDDYGAENEAEFFAVATECFFEKPHALRRRHPELYDELSGFYGQDPAAWPAAGGGSPDRPDETRSAPGT